MAKKANVPLPSGTEISFYKSGPRDAARYVSATAVHEEALEHGRWIGLYWSASGQVQRENVTQTLPALPAGSNTLTRPAHSFELEIDGQSLHNRWEWVGSSRREGKRGTTEAVVELRHQVRPVTVKVVTRLDGSPILVRYLEIANTGKAPAALGSVSPWSGILWPREQGRISMNPTFNERTTPPFTLGYLKGEDWGEEGDFTWQALPPENFRLERTAHGRSWGSPYYILRCEPTGEMFFLGLAWGGNFMAEFAYKYGTMLTFRLAPVGPAPLRVIDPGETVTSPEVHMGPLHCGMDEAVGQWHRHMRASVVPPRPKGREMYTIAGRVVEEPNEWILREIDIAAEMGVEAFMVDAGWYGSTFAGWWEQRGDWNEGSWLPGGIAGIRDYTRKKGMLFGLWHEAEALSKKAKLREKHPDWVLTTDDGRECAETLNLANPQAARFFADTILRIIKGYKLDFYKLDYNVGVGEGGQNERSGFAESEFWRHQEAVHGAYDRVLAECPGVCLENCGGGGGRNDLGMLSRFHYACESDWSVFPYSIRAINAMSLFLPPEAICYYHNHIGHAHQMADLDTHLRVTLFATPIFVGFGAQSADRSTDYFRKTRRYIDLHKGFCRPVLAGPPEVFHHTPDIGLRNPSEWCVLEYATRDRTRGYAGVFKVAAGTGEYLLRPRGVDLAAEYDVTLDNGGRTFRMSGRELGVTGLTIRLDSVFTSELVMYQRTSPAGRARRTR